MSVVKNIKPYLNVLQQSTLFKNISAEKIERLFSNINYQISSYHKDDIIFSTGLHANHLGIVLDGSVAVQKIFPDGNSMVILSLKKSEVFGEFIIFSKKKEYPVDIVATKCCKILLISRKNMLKMLLSDREILASFLESAAERMIKLHEKIEILSLNSISKKIAYSLIKEMTKQNTDSKIKLPFSKTTWAAQMNVSRPALSRELKKMSLQGILSFNRREIKIRDIKKLQQLLEVDFS